MNKKIWLVILMFSLSLISEIAIAHSLDFKNSDLIKIVKHDYCGVAYLNYSNGYVYAEGYGLIKENDNNKALAIRAAKLCSKVVLLSGIKEIHVSSDDGTLGEMMKKNEAVKKTVEQMEIEYIDEIKYKRDDEMKDRVDKNVIVVTIRSKMSTFIFLVK